MILGVAVLPAAKGAGEVEPEAVHVHLLHPVVKAVHQETGDHRVVAVHRVAATGEVSIKTTVRGVQVVEDLVAEPLEADGGTPLVSFRSVVEDDVEDQPDARPVERLDHVTELVPRPDRADAVARMGGVEAVGAVAPVVLEPQSGRFGRHVLSVEGHHGQQLDMGDAEILQVRDLVDECPKGPGMLRTGGGVPGEAPHVQLVDDRLLQRNIEGRVAFPVVGITHNERAHCPRGVVSGGRRCPAVP